jgi:hypothetical protein
MLAMYRKATVKHENSIYLFMCCPGTTWIKSSDSTSPPPKRLSTKLALSMPSRANGWLLKRRKAGISYV